MAAQEQVPQVYSVAKLLTLSQKELDALFTNSSPGAIPDGEAQGTAIIAPGTTYSQEIATIVNHFAWQGKTFDAAHGSLRNRITTLGINAIIAKVYKGTSWFDNKECIVLDYSETSIVAKRIRDEIRQISPGVYLGVVFWDKIRTINFALDFNHK
jgi:hypothetical protein